MTEYKRHIYKVDDKVVIRLDNTAKNRLNKGKTDITISTKQFSDELTDLQPVEEKIKFTPEMKKEFDKLKSLGCVTPYAFMSAMHTCDYPALKKWINADSVDKCVINQFEFSRAILDESLIVVIGETVKIVQVGGRNLWEHDGEYLLVNHCDINNEHYYFTKSEVERITQLEQFKYIDLVAAWEDMK